MGRRDNTKNKAFAVAPITNNVRDHDNAHTTYANHKCLIREYVHECDHVQAHVRECVHE